jgi:hypothetical protein
MPPAKKSANAPAALKAPMITISERVAEGADAIAILLFEESLASHPYPGLDEALNNAITQALALGDFKAKAG